MNPDRMPTLRVRTPEGVVFGFLIASPVARMSAWAIDQLVITTAWATVASAIGVLGLVSMDLATAVTAWGYFILVLGYPMACEWGWNGQTIGKRLLRLRVMDDRGLRLGFGQVVIRNLLRSVDALPLGYMTGGLAALFNRKGQRLGDIAGGTIVVREPEIAAPDWEAMGRPKYNSLRQHPHIAARLRQTLAPGEVRIAVLALLRREQLDANTRVRLFAEISAHLESVVAIPAEAREGISDEQFVRNVVDAVG